MSGEAGGRIFFSNVRRSLEVEDEIRLASVGVDIGSSTSHLVFSRLVLERLDNRYVVSERKVVHESEVLLTPYAGDASIDAVALGRFIDRQYELAGVDSKAIDTGALILPGVAVRRSNARAIGGLFGAEVGLVLQIGEKPDADRLNTMVERMADHLFEIISKTALGADAAGLLRLAPLRNGRKPDVVSFSGGVSEYVYGREDRAFGDLGPAFARAILARIESWGPRIEPSAEGIRATVIGASQYTIQVSGSTILVAPQSVLPLRNVPVVTPNLPLDAETLAVERISESVGAALRRLDLDDGERAVALCYRWKGSATYARLDAFCRGIVAGFANGLGRGLPLILVGDGDVGGLIGIHCREETGLSNPIVSIDGIVLKEFDFIDIGALLETSGAVPVVIKSLVFPASAAVGVQASRVR